MTIKTPGQECLTRTQEAGRAVMAQIRAKEGLPQTAGTRTLLDDKSSVTSSLTSNAISAATFIDSGNQARGSVDSQFLDISV